MVKLLVSCVASWIFFHYLRQWPDLTVIDALITVTAWVALAETAPFIPNTEAE